MDREAEECWQRLGDGGALFPIWRSLDLVSGSVSKGSEHSGMTRIKFLEGDR